MFMLLFYCVQAQSQRKKGSYKHTIAIKNNLNSYLLNTTYLTLEVKTTKSTSVQISRHYIDHLKKGLNMSSQEDSHIVWGTGYTLEYRWYKGKQALKGTYYGPYIRFHQLDVLREPSYASYPNQQLTHDRSKYSLGFVTGYQRISTLGIGFDLYLGLGAAVFKEYNFKGDMDLYEKYSDRIEVRLGINIVGGI